ncbi:MAG: STAS domain-containing protein [Acinetobacter sp.]
MIEFKQQHIVLKGHIDFANAEQVYLQGLQFIKSQQQFPVVVDLSQLSQGNTMLLAILVQWLRQMPEPQNLLFKAVPEKMLKIIQACHLEHDLQMVA